MAQAVKMPWGALRPATEPYLSYPGATKVELDEEGRVLGAAKATPKKTVRKKAARKKAAIPSIDNSDLGDLDELDNL